ncbi:hypothetical protein LINGRAHAP2_LOCUS32058 [Linum grandiflorum]
MIQALQSVMVPFPGAILCDHRYQVSTQPLSSFLSDSLVH